MKVTPAGIKVLSADFYDRPTLDVARDLIGKLLVREHPSGRRLVGRIVETEAYTQDDPSFHGWGIVDLTTGLIKPDGRGFDLFGKPGTAYVYLIYARNWLLNVVTEREGVGGAVLFRAVEPVEGQSSMYERREAAASDIDLTNGPGKLTQAFDIDKEFHNRPMTKGCLYVAEPQECGTWPVSTSCRIGITRGVELPWRYFVEGNPYVSPGIPSDIAAERRRRRRNGRAH
ncbi:MAG: DNA-3-methyladenine glycosylase [Rhodothermales bacterium]